MRINVVSMSGGKDSTATALVCREVEPADSIRYVFADTGNEHEATLEYVHDYLPRALGAPIVTLRRDFTDWWWHRRRFVAERWPLPHHKWPNGVPQAIVDRVLAVLDKGPTGNPYLDLCIIKGRFPSRRAQFCTQFLKTEPLTEYAMGLIDKGYAVWSWQGIRADEGGRRRWAKEFEEVGGGLYIHRPILRWTAADCFEAMQVCGVEPNPLYKLGMGRVGCMPCINAGKDEVREIAKRFPAHIDRIEEWEAVVGLASKRGTSFFPAPEDGRADIMGRNVREVVQWSRTTRGGRQVSLFADDEPSACSSSYGLCETQDEPAEVEWLSRTA